MIGPWRKALFTEKSFASLESGGRLIIHDVLYNDEKTGPVRGGGIQHADDGMDGG